MALSQVLAEFRAEAPVLAGSLAVVLFMVGMAWMLGFRAKRALDDADLTRLAEAEGAGVEAAIIAPDRRAAFARLNNGKLMIARVMGDDLSFRAAPAAAVRVAVGEGRLSAAFADVGYPPLHMKIEETPPWLADLAKGKGQNRG